MTEHAQQIVETQELEKLDGNQVVEVQGQSTEITPLAMLDRALSSGATPETLERLMALQERWEANQARKSFDNAMAAAKAEIPVIEKKRHVGFDSKKAGAARTDYYHEDLATIAETVAPIIARYGLSYRFRTPSNANEPVTVTCIVSHRDGHSEENTLSAGRDESGNKNSIQGIGSTITYLQRYTLKAALGLAAAADDDVQSADDETPITDVQRDKLSVKIEEVGADIQAFCNYLKVDALKDLPASKFDDAMKALDKKAKSNG